MVDVDAWTPRQLNLLRKKPFSAKYSTRTWRALWNSALHVLPSKWAEERQMASHTSSHALGGAPQAPNNSRCRIPAQ